MPEYRMFSFDASFVNALIIHTFYETYQVGYSKKERDRELEPTEQKEMALKKNLS